MESLPIVNEARNVRPPVDPATLSHRNLLEGDFWRRIPAYANVSDQQFLDHHWQAKQSITKVRQAARDACAASSRTSFISRREAEGFARSPMAVRISPYLLALIDWDDPYEDPMRRQFIPIAAARSCPTTRSSSLDSLQRAGPTRRCAGLTHRYPDKALFLALDTCPVYCRFCTRSYAVGIDTDQGESRS
jgi:lysine 2,3-aminomutase